jgi:hypothetical protein
MNDINKKITDEEMLYNYYSPYNLNFLVGMFNQLKRSFTEILKAEDKERTVKIILMRYELVARYCQFAESIGALILGYHNLKLSSNTKLNKDHSKQILDFLSSYCVKDIDKFYSDINNNSFEGDFKIIFGYDILYKSLKQCIDESINNIFDHLIKISESYLKYKESYNAYKHGYRVWIKYENDIPAILYRDRKKQEKVILLTDSDLEYVIHSSDYCKMLYQIITNNHKEIFYNYINSKKKDNPLKIMLCENKIN